MFSFVRSTPLISSLVSLYALSATTMVAADTLKGTAQLDFFLIDIPESDGGPCPDVSVADNIAVYTGTQDKTKYCGKNVKLTYTDITGKQATHVFKYGDEALSADRVWIMETGAIDYVLNGQSFIDSNIEKVQYKEAQWELEL